MIEEWKTGFDIQHLQQSDVVIKVCTFSTGASISIDQCAARTRHDQMEDALLLGAEYMRKEGNDGIRCRHSRI